MVLLGDVREGEKMSECSRDRNRLGHGQLLEKPLERSKILVASTPRTLGSSANPLDCFEQRVTLMLAKRVAEQAAQESDIVAEWLERVARHRLMV